MFDKKGLKSARKYRDELSKRGEASPTDFYIREFGLHPGLSTLLLNGAFLKEVWGDFTLAEKRFIAHMYEQYYVWRYFLLNIRKRDNKSTCITPLQQAAFENQWDANGFFSYLLEKLTTLEQISEGLDRIKSFEKYQPADAFEASCYFFLIAYHCLKNESTRLEYQNALSEALEHQGEFRGWAAAMLYKNELYEKFEKRDKDLGIFKLKAMWLLEEWYINSGGGMFKSDTEVQSRLNEELLKLNNEIMSGREDFSSSIKNWYDAKNPDFKTLIKRLVRK
ncbi:MULTISPECIES: hypothetical protein [Enterobacteriaceae]|nr:MULTISPECIES: hypothetical protein [Enterobacteriaceae]TKU11488.1 hypothetical protein FDW86_03775 [Citrobacter sp. wls828]MCH6463503.1 hypothetical protein [Escherichia coli]MCQ7060954.1 hypothetical protein [Escherichia coli]MCY3451762.1 hypothetical protein [Citrobacter freundii]MDD9223320.1 hypothetical protein [Enterobacter kobei]